MSTPVMSRWSIFLLAFLVRFFASFLLPVPEPLSPEMQTLVFALLYGIFASLPKVLVLWFCAAYLQKYLLEVLFACLGFVAASAGYMLFQEEAAVWFISVIALVHFVVILGTYHLVVRQLKTKMNHWGK